MALDEETEQRKLRGGVSPDPGNAETGSPEDDERSIELLQWYLKMAIENQDEPA